MRNTQIAIANQQLKMIKNMAFFHYTIQENKILAFTGEVENIPTGFHHYERSFGEGEINYKINEGKITEIVCEIENREVKSRVEVKEFLNNLLLG